MPKTAKQQNRMRQASGTHLLDNKHAIWAAGSRYSARVFFHSHVVRSVSGRSTSSYVRRELDTFGRSEMIANEIRTEHCRLLRIARQGKTEDGVMLLYTTTAK